MESGAKQQSTMMHEPQYDRETRTLTINFKKGGVYTYANFSEANFDEFIAAPSWGKFYHANKNLFENGAKQASPVEEPVAS